MTVTLKVPLPITITPPNGKRSVLPILDLNRHQVMSTRRRVRLRRGSKKRKAADCSFGKFGDHLHFDAWPFFHAAVKTELTRSFTHHDVDRAALCLWGQHQDFFVWNTDNLRRIDRSVFDLEEFGASSRAGRFAESVAHLVMVRKGYIYWDRIGSLWERAMRKRKVEHKEQLRRARLIAARVGSFQPALQPDFAMENESGEAVLMESKGSFVHPEYDRPTVKDDLRHALKQLTAWSDLVTPTPRKSFGIGTYFRDASDNGGDPSLIAVVDPPNTGRMDAPAVEFPSDWIRRGNYGAWLIGMGFGAAGDALRNGAEYRTRQVPLPILRIGRLSYAVVAQRVVLDDRHVPPHRAFDDPFFWHLWRGVQPLPHWILRDLGVSGVEVFGLERGVMHKLSHALANPESTTLLDASEADGDAPPQGRQVIETFSSPDGFYGSIMPDGSLLGLLRPRDIGLLREEVFEL